VLGVFFSKVSRSGSGLVSRRPWGTDVSKKKNSGRVVNMRFPFLSRRNRAFSSRQGQCELLAGNMSRGWYCTR
jgi:hypothetical protein